LDWILVKKGLVWLRGAFYCWVSDSVVVV